MLYSYGRSFSLFTEIGSSFQTELSKLWPKPIEYYELTVTLEQADENSPESALVKYINAEFSNLRLDLVVSIGAPAAWFCVKHRRFLLPSTPVLVAGVDQKWIATVPNDEAVIKAPVVVDIPANIEGILRVLPDTRDVIVVLGDSSQSRAWLPRLQREFAGLSDRIRFTYTNEWSLEEMEKRFAALPPNTAIFFGELSLDAAGIPHLEHTALERVHAVANAPIFGFYYSQFGKGIVGGALISEEEAGREGAFAAKRILSGEDPRAIEGRIVSAGQPVYDFRELKRWKIPEELLPPGSTILFRVTGRGRSTAITSWRVSV